MEYGIKKVGIDIGKSSFKYVSESVTGKIPNYTARGTLTRVFGEPGSQPSLVRYKGSDWIVGLDALNGSNFVWKTDAEKGDERNLIFLFSILAGLGITNAEIVVGLPVSSADSKKKTEAVKSMFSGVKEAVVNGKPMTFTIKTRILPEPLGTYFSLVLDEQCRPIKPNPYFHDQMVIIDIGYRTVDIVTIQAGKLSTVKDSTMSGTVTFFEKTWKAIEAEHGILQWSDKVRIYNTIVKHFGEANLKANGEYMSPKFWETVAAFRAELARDIADEIRSILSSVRPDRMLVTGGGALFLKDDLLSNIRQLSFHPNPRFANAMGFYRAARITTPDESE